MKSYFRIFFLTLFLYLGTTGNGIGINNNIPSSCLFNRIDISNGCSISFMKRSNPTNYHLLVVLRIGVDEKNILFSYPLERRPSFNNNSLKDVVVINAGFVKYILSFSHFFALQPEFLSSSSFRSPPSSIRT